MPSEPAPVAPAGWRAYGHPAVRSMLLFGYSCGLPFVLVTSTLSFWLKDAGIAITTIGFFAAVRNVYSLKVLWAPLLDRLPLPLLTRLLGRRRSWILVGQVIVAAALLFMSRCSPATELSVLTAATIVAAIGSATQDAAVDAWRIEATAAELQAAMLAAYTLGYRLAILTSGWGALQLVHIIGWPAVYRLMAALGLIGVLTTFLTREPSALAMPSHIGNGVHWLRAAVIDPFSEYFTRYPLRQAAWLLLFVALYRLSDYSIGNMASTLYKDLGFSNAEIGNVVKFAGFFTTIAGAALAGWLMQRILLERGLLLAALLMASTNAAFAWLATEGHRMAALAVVVSAENFAQGFGGVVFVAFLSALTDRRHTATQYALFSSLTILIGHTLASFGGIAVSHYGYVEFFIVTGLLGLPAILMSLHLLLRRQAGRGIVFANAGAEPAKES